VNTLVYVVVFLFCAILFIVGVFNGGEVTLNLVFWQVGPAPMGAVIATAALVGMAFAAAIGVVDGIKIRIANRQLRRQLQRAEEEVDALRLRLARRDGGAATGEPERQGSPPSAC
jgi:uncharacterized integral membrane protein